MIRKVWVLTLGNYDYEAPEKVYATAESALAAYEEFNSKRVAGSMSEAAYIYEIPFEDESK